MNCDEVRFALEAEPGTRDPGVAAHLQQCSDCAGYARELQALNRRLRAALEVAVPAARPVVPEVVELPPRAPIASWRSRRFVRPLALAASVAAVAIVAGLLWIAFPRESLAADVVGHMVHEPAAWDTTQPVPAARVAAVLDRKDVALRRGAVDVTYAQTCWFRGHRVPHLVVRTADGPVTVMVLTHEAVAARTAFDEDGYHGVIVPATHGSLAVLGRGTTDVDDAAARTLAALEYR